MVSDDERREVAARLRELHLGGGSKDLIELTLSDAIGAWRESGMSWDFITERLADLIDPDCEEGRYSVARTVRPVDRGALLALAEELDGLGLTGFSSGWSSGAVNVGSFARRIREALGVTDHADA